MYIEKRLVRMTVKSQTVKMLLDVMLRIVMIMTSPFGDDVGGCNKRLLTPAKRCGYCNIILIVMMTYMLINVITMMIQTMMIVTKIIAMEIIIRMPSMIMRVVLNNKGMKILRMLLGLNIKSISLLKVENNELIISKFDSLL